MHRDNPIHLAYGIYNSRRLLAALRPVVIYSCPVLDHGDSKAFTISMIRHTRLYYTPSLIDSCYIVLYTYIHYNKSLKMY